MATESKMEMILQNLKTVLATIDGEDGYWTEVKSVKRVPFVPTEFQGEDKPGILIVATGEPEIIENQHSYHDKRDLKVGIIGVLDRPENDEGTAINRFMKDIGIAIMLDPTRGGYANQTFKVSQSDESNLFGDLCLLVIEINIRYHVDGREE